MTLQHPTVLVIGSSERAEALQDYATMVFHPQDVMEALGMYIFHYPDVTIIEGHDPNAAEVYMHLRSIDVESIVILTDTPDDWDIPASSAIYVLPSAASPACAELMTSLSTHQRSAWH